jgi:uncharacterized protein YjbJ (UPF0337 family)
MPSRSSREDKNEGAMDRAKGRMKEAGGVLTGDKDKRREGRSDQRKGRAKEKKGNLKALLSQNRRASAKGPGLLTAPALLLALIRRSA